MYVNLAWIVSNFLRQVSYIFNLFYNLFQSLQYLRFTTSITPELHFMDKGDEIKIWAELIYHRSTPNHIKVSLVLIKLSFFMLPVLIFAFRTETNIYPLCTLVFPSATLIDKFYSPKLEEANAHASITKPLNTIGYCCSQLLTQVNFQHH